VLWMLLKWDRGWTEPMTVFVAAGAAICTGVSGLLYVYDGVRQLSSSPSSFASTTQPKKRGDGAVE